MARPGSARRRTHRGPRPPYGGRQTRGCRLADVTGIARRAARRVGGRARRGPARRDRRDEAARARVDERVRSLGECRASGRGPTAPRRGLPRRLGERPFGRRVGGAAKCGAALDLNSHDEVAPAGPTTSSVVSRPASSRRRRDSSLDCAAAPTRLANLFLPREARRGGAASIAIPLCLAMAWPSPRSRFSPTTPTRVTSRPPSVSTSTSAGPHPGPTAKSTGRTSACLRTARNFATRCSICARSVHRARTLGSATRSDRARPVPSPRTRDRRARQRAGHPTPRSRARDLRGSGRARPRRPPARTARARLALRPHVVLRRRPPSSAVRLVRRRRRRSRVERRPIACERGPVG